MKKISQYCPGCRVMKRLDLDVCGCGTNLKKIRRNGDARLHARFKDVKGNRSWEYLGNTVMEARRALDEKTAMMDSGEWSPGKKDLKYEDFMALHYWPWRQLDVEKGTKDKRKTAGAWKVEKRRYEMYLQPFFGTMALSNFRSKHVAEYFPPRQVPAHD